MKQVAVFLIFLLGFAFAQATTTPPKLDIWAILLQIWQFVTGNPVVSGPIVAYLLTLIPGPFRSIVEAVVKAYLEGATKRKAEDAVKASYDQAKPELGKAMSDQRKAEINERALKEATQIAQDLGVPKEEAEIRVRAAFRTLKASGEVQ
jgi:hypothetical protein